MRHPTWRRWLETPWPLLIAGALVVWVLVRPWGDFPLDDDWSYAGTVRRWIETGELRLSDWSGPIALPPLALAALAHLPFESVHHVLLRVLTTCWAVAGAGCFFILVRERGVGLGVAWWCVATLVCSPVFLLLSLSFQTDVPFLAMTLIALRFFDRALRNGRARDEWIAGFVMAAAALTRQIGAALALGACFALLAQRSFAAGRFFRLAGPAAAGLAVFYSWFTFAHGPTWAHSQYVTAGTIAHWSSPGRFAALSAERLLIAVSLASLWCCGQIFIRRAEPWSRRDVWTVLSAALSLWSVFELSGINIAVGPTFHRLGLGTLTLYRGEVWKPGGIFASGSLWNLFVPVASVSFGVFAARMRRAPSGAALLLLPACAAALATLAGAKFFDRYVLNFLPPVLLVVAMTSPTARVAWPAWALSGAWAVLSLAGANDYFAWSRARWFLAEKAVSMGYEPGRVAAGFEWNAHHLYDAYMLEARAKKPLFAISEWEWEQPHHVQAIVMAAPDAFPPAFKLASARYRSWLAPRGAEIYLYRRQTEDDPAAKTPSPAR